MPASMPDVNSTPRLVSGKHAMGWRRDTPDHNDVHYAAPRSVLQQLPPLVDLRGSLMPAIYDQGELGSCTGNACAGLLSFIHHKEAHPDAGRTPSRLMLYWLARYLEGTTSSDAGAEIRDVIKAAVKWGTAFEDGGVALWPYDITKFADRPSDVCFQAARQFHAIEYRRIAQDTRAMRACLAEGFPFIGGFTVYENFESDEVARTGVMPMPRGNVLGGHAVMYCGYDDTGDKWPARTFLTRNSWGSNWGADGFFYTPYEVLARSDLSSDFWTVRVVS